MGEIKATYIKTEYGIYVSFISDEHGVVFEARHSDFSTESFESFIRYEFGGIIVSITQFGYGIREYEIESEYEPVDAVNRERFEIITFV